MMRLLPPKKRQVVKCMYWQYPPIATGQTGCKYAKMAVFIFRIFWLPFCIVRRVVHLPVQSTGTTLTAAFRLSAVLLL